MVSRALTRWNTTSASKLDQVASAHSAIGGKKPGRRFATDQINHAYLVLLAGAFQGFCRDLHTECVTALLGSLGAAQPVEAVLLANAMQSRQLDARNATRSTIQVDFTRLGLQVLAHLKATRPSNEKRLVALDRLNAWRNAIAHQDFARRSLVPANLRLSTIRTWRSQCGILARDLDQVMFAHLKQLAGIAPW